MSNGTLKMIRKMVEITWFRMLSSRRMLTTLINTQNQILSFSSKTQISSGWEKRDFAYEFDNQNISALGGQSLEFHAESIFDTQCWFDVANPGINYDIQWSLSSSLKIYIIIIAVSRYRTRKQRTIWQSLRKHRVAFYLFYFSLLQHYYENRPTMLWDTMVSSKIPQRPTLCWPKALLAESVHTLEDLTILKRQVHPRSVWRSAAFKNKDHITGRRL